jgi:hypothetical protein
MSGTDLDLVVRARRAVLDGALRPCSAGARAGRAGLADLPSRAHERFRLRSE